MIISVEIVASCGHEEENKRRQKQTKLAQGKKKQHTHYVSKANIQCILHQNISRESRGNNGSFILLEKSMFCTKMSMLN